MAKIQLTIDLEKRIWRATKKQGVFGCFEVTIGWYGHERVDYMTFDTKGNWRCYEIKVTREDFKSKAHITFVGHYNYYVMPRELYEMVQSEIPDGIGVYVEGEDTSACIIRAKKRPLAIDERILTNSMIRSLARDAGRVIDDRDTLKVMNLESHIRHLQSELRESSESRRNNMMEYTMIKSFLRKQGLYAAYRMEQEGESTSLRCDMESKIVDIKLVNTLKGILAIHLCRTVDTHTALANPKFCNGWYRVEPKLWRPRHLMSYGRRCLICGGQMPSEEYLEALYSAAEQAGLDKLEQMDI